MIIRRLQQLSLSLLLLMVVTACHHHGLRRPHGGHVIHLQPILGEFSAQISLPKTTIKINSK